MNLTEELAKFKDEFVKNAPKEVQSEMKAAHEELLTKKIGTSSLDVGDMFPEFELQNQKLNSINTSKLLSNNKFLIISFYRGGWCPYCNLELRALQQNLSEFRGYNANLVAITPEKPDESLTTSEKNELDFEVLSDTNSILAREVGISFELPENLKPLYQNFGIDIQKHNGKDNFTLPVPATYLINEDRKIIFAYKDLDYTKRLDPQEILNILKSEL